MEKFKKIRIQVVVAALSIGGVAVTAIGNTAAPVSADATNGAGLRFLGRWTSGSGLGGAEISAYDAASQRIFVTNGKTNQIDIVDISKPGKTKKVKSIDLAAKGATGIQSVATKNGLVAIATSVDGNAQGNGKIFFTDTNGKLTKGVESGIEVGALPDHVSFSPDGRYVLSANEGEPKSYCKAADGTLPVTTDPYGTVSIIDVGGTKPSAATTINFESFNDRATSLVFGGGRVFGPGATLAQDLEPEYITMSSDSKYAYVTLQENNAIATIDMATKSVLSISGLNYKKHADNNKGLDAISDKGPLVVSQTVLGMYQPDAIATLVGPDGTEYLVTANEGDAREWPCLLGGTDATKAEGEEMKLSSAADSTDATITALGKVIGSLGVTPFAPSNPRLSTITSSTKVKLAHSFGARSFSIWQPAVGTEGTDTMTQVWDSGQQLEALTAARRPLYFNADWDTTTGAIKAVDARSTKKGPEPEAVAVGKAYGKTWIAVGMERDGGVALYDASNPVAPEFVDYINTSDPNGNLNTGNAGDVSPEGILFVSEEESPTGAALVVVSFELSGTVAIYEIPRKTPSKIARVTTKVEAGKAKFSFKKPDTAGWNSDVTYQLKCSSSRGALVASSTTNKLIATVPTSLRGVTATCEVFAKTSLGRGAKGNKFEVKLK